MPSSQEEWFDIVDASDAVIGRGMRGDVHRQRLFHRSVHIFVFDGQGRLLIQRRSMLKDTNPGRWTTSCSGHVDSGEEYDAAALRELREEIGVALDNGHPRPEFRFKVSPCRETGNEFSSVYRLEWDGTVRPEPGEVDALQWVPVPALEAWARRSPRSFARSFLFLWEKVRSTQS